MKKLIILENEKKLILSLYNINEQYNVPLIDYSKVAPESTSIDRSNLEAYFNYKSSVPKKFEGVLKTSDTLFFVFPGNYEKNRSIEEKVGLGYALDYGIISAILETYQDLVDLVKFCIKNNKIFKKLIVGSHGQPGSLFQPADYTKKSGVDPQKWYQTDWLKELKKIVDPSGEVHFTACYGGEVLVTIKKAAEVLGVRAYGGKGIGYYGAAHQNGYYSCSSTQISSKDFNDYYILGEDGSYYAKDGVIPNVAINKIPTYPFKNTQEEQLFRTWLNNKNEKLAELLKVARQSVSSDLNSGFIMRAWNYKWNWDTGATNAVKTLGQWFSEDMKNRTQPATYSWSSGNQTLPQVDLGTGDFSITKTSVRQKTEEPKPIIINKDVEKLTAYPNNSYNYSDKFLLKYGYCRKDNQPISFLNLGQMVGRIYKSITNDKYRQNPSYIPNWAQERADNIRRGK